MLSGQAATIDAAIAKLAVRLHETGQQHVDVPRDGSCFFHAVALDLVRLLGLPAATQQLGTLDISAAAVRAFLCRWAEENRDLVIDDAGEDTLQTLVVHAANVWPKPIGAYLRLPEGDRLPAQFSEVITRMRRGEWADDFCHSGSEQRRLPHLDAGRHTCAPSVEDATR